MYRLGLTIALCAVSFACSDEAAIAPPAIPDTPGPAFLALDRKGRNLAVYDAFWDHLRANYYDPEAFSSEDWRAFQARWRIEAPEAGTSIDLYHSYFPRLLQHMPESHVEVTGPNGATDAGVQNASRRVDEDTAKRLATLMFVHGPGFTPADVRRAAHRRNVIAEVSPNSPAAEAGVAPGARLLRSLATLDEAAKAVHFEVDFVPLNADEAREWERGGQSALPPPPASIVRARFDLRPFPYRQAVDVRRLAGSVQYLRFDAFGDHEFMKPIFEAIDAAGAAGLIVDLRWNAGGDAEQLREFSGALLGSHVRLAELRDRTGTREMLTAGHRTAYSGSLVVLTGPATASAAEVFAAAVRQLGRGKVIGRSTAGAALGAQGFPLPDGGTVRLPVVDLRSPGGQRIEGIGVEPDIWILPTIDDVRGGHDPVIERALREINRGGSS